MTAPIWNEGKQSLEIGLDSSNMRTEDQASSVLIGIDFGTTFSGVSWALQSGSPGDIHIVSSWNEKPKTPSMQPQGKRLLLIDTPKFDDTQSSGGKPLQIVAEYFQELYKRQTGISGTIYIHQIPDESMTRPNFQNLEIFQRLCGCECASNTLATTDWKSTKRDTIRHQQESSLRKTNALRLLCENPTRRPEASQEISWFWWSLMELLQALNMIHRNVSQELDRDQDASGALYGNRLDIKPETILLSKNSEIGGHFVFNVADFGLGGSKEQEAQCRAGARCPKGNRASTQQHELWDIHPEGATSRAYDIWSLGCSLVEVIKWYDLGQDRMNNTRVRDAIFSTHKSNYLLHTHQLNIADRRMIYIDDTRNLFSNLIANQTKGKVDHYSRESSHHLKDGQSRTARDMDVIILTSRLMNHIMEMIRSLLSNGFIKGARATTNISCLAPLLLLFTTPASASPTFAKGCTPTLQQQIANFLHKATHRGEDMQPDELLLTLLLETLILVALYTHNREDSEQKYFLGAGLLCSGIAGAMYSKTAQHFVLEYLFLGCLVALLGSAISHAVQRRRERGITMTEKEFCAEKAGFEDGVSKDEEM